MIVVLIKLREEANRRRSELTVAIITTTATSEREATEEALRSLRCAARPSEPSEYYLLLKLFPFYMFFFLRINNEFTCLKSFVYRLIHSSSPVVSAVFLVFSRTQYTVKSAILNTARYASAFRIERHGFVQLSSGELSAEQHGLGCITR